MIDVKVPFSIWFFRFQTRSEFGFYSSESFILDRNHVIHYSFTSSVLLAFYNSIETLKWKVALSAQFLQFAERKITNKKREFLCRLYIYKLSLFFVSIHIFDRVFSVNTVIVFIYFIIYIHCSQLSEIWNERCEYCSVILEMKQMTSHSYTWRTFTRFRWCQRNQCFLSTYEISVSFTSLDVICFALLRFNLAWLNLL